MALAENEIEVEHVVYPKDARSSKFTAVAVSPLQLKANDTRLADICIFSQYPLKECEKIGTLVYSETQKGEGPLRWKYLCNGLTKDTKNVHVFDVEYLKPYLDMKTAEFAHCPLCKSGIYEEKKEHVEEFDIDTMEQLVQKRDEAKTSNDLMLELFQEQLIVEKACHEKWDPTLNSSRIKKNEEHLQAVLKHWQDVKKIDEFRPKILEGARIAMNKDMSNIIAIILESCNYNTSNQPEDRQQELVELVNHGCSIEAYDSVEHIFKKHKKLNIENRPVCLFNAIKSGNTDLTDLVFAYLKSLDRTFVCDQCFTQSIKSDNVAAARDILLARWHKPNDDDYTLAERMDNSVSSFLAERKNATALITTVADSSQALTWDDDDEWGGENEEEEWADEENEKENEQEWGDDGDNN